jgi:hypothetical protein
VPSSPSAPSLRDIIESARRRTLIVRRAKGGRRFKATLDDLTALSSDNDPFRLDTPANHRDGEWFAEIHKKAGRAIHCRGVHYIALGETKPNGERYTNTAKDWTDIQRWAAAARWLGFVPFDSVLDERNAEPVFRLFTPPTPHPYITLGEVEISVPDEIKPDVDLFGFYAAQPFRIAMFGEKTSLEPVLGPIADEYDADLLLPTGEASATMVHALARNAAEDGRPLVIFYFSDADPSGWQMAVSVARKLQALEAGFFPGLDWTLQPVALHPDHVRKYELPSDPLKDGEKRAKAWKAAYGVAGTEIDALATLQPAVLRQLAHEAIEPFYDRTLARRANEIRREWEERARQVLVDQVGAEQLEQMEREAEAIVAQLEELREQANDKMRVEAIDGVELPELPELPEPELENQGEASPPLISSDWSWVDQTRRLIDHKSYGQADPHIEDRACAVCGSVEAMLDRQPDLNACAEHQKEWREILKARREAGR